MGVGMGMGMGMGMGVGVGVGVGMGVGVGVGMGMGVGMAMVCGLGCGCVTHFSSRRVPRPRSSSTDARGSGWIESTCPGFVRDAWDSGSRDWSATHVQRPHTASTCRVAIKESHLPWYGDSSASPKCAPKMCSRSGSCSGRITRGGGGGGGAPPSTRANWPPPA